MNGNGENGDRLQLLTVRDLSGRLRIHTGTLWRLTALAEAGLPCNGFPRPLRLGPQTVRWRTADVERYLGALAGGSVQP